MNAQIDDTPRVLHLITRFSHGGAEKTTVNTLHSLQCSDISYDLRLGVGKEFDEERLASLESTGISTTVFQTIRHYNPIASLIAIFAVAFYLWREEIDVLHTHSTEAGIIGRFAGFLAGTPIILHEVHGDPVAVDRNSILNLFIIYAERLAALFTTHLIVKSKRIKESYLQRRIGRSEQYKLIYHGVNLQIFNEQTESIHDEKNTNPYQVLFVGRLADGKGLYDLLQAFEQLELRAELQIIGSGQLREQLETEVNHRHLTDTVSFLGYRDDVPKLLAEADVLVLPSYREGTPRVISEALASGTPVISTDIAGIPEQVSEGETGYLVEPGDVDAIVNRLHQLLENDEIYRRFSERAADSVEKFSFKNSKSQYQQLYGELLRKKN